MKRNYQFEVQFLLAVLAVVLGSRLDPIANLVLLPILYIAIVLVSIHVVMLVVIYSVRRGTSHEFPTITTLEDASNFSLLGVGFLSGCLLINFIMNGAAELFNPLGKYIENDIVEGLLTIAIAAVIVIVIGYKTMNEYKLSRDVEVIVVPSHIDVHHEFQDSDTLAITVRNHSDQLLDLSIEVELPDEVIHRKTGAESEGKCSNFTWSTECASERQEQMDLEFRHDLSEEMRLMRTARVTIEYNDHKTTEEVEMMVDSYGGL